ncbi:MAG: hypothetical protein FWF75_03185 [Propionibacteriaceae bacterium]|nr:hypothetical protein [Propionibacteriaceae bacterium]
MAQEDTPSRPVDRALDALAERADSAQLRQLCTDVREHRRPMIDLLASPEFCRLARQGGEVFEQRLRAMSPEQRQAFRQQALQLARSRGVFGEHEDPYELCFGNVSFDEC